MVHALNVRFPRVMESVFSSAALSACQETLSLILDKIYMFASMKCLLSKKPISVATVKRRRHNQMLASCSLHVVASALNAVKENVTAYVINV